MDVGTVVVHKSLGRGVVQEPSNKELNICLVKFDNVDERHARMVLVDVEALRAEGGGLC